jgi:steroid 5-alpha reductase family enzyme
VSPFVQTLLETGAVTVGAMILVWVAAMIRRDVGIVDVYWGISFVVAAWLAVAMNPPATPRSLVVAALTGAWGLRLSIHVARRNRGRGEDRRYAAMRDRHGDRFPLVSLFTVFLLQAAIAWFVSWPIQATAVARTAEFPKAVDVLGMLVWGVGFLFEAVGDGQLTKFLADPRNRGRVMERGLWRYTRHPNYFGDACVWWGLYLLAAAGGGAWTAASPLLMTFLLMRVSGVTLLERTIIDRRPEYAAYQARTNAFFPGPPKPRDDEVSPDRAAKP